MKNPKPTDEDVADAIKRTEGTPGDTSEVPGSGCGWFLSMEENGKSCSRILLGGVLGGGIGMIVGVVGGTGEWFGPWRGGPITELFGVLLLGLGGGVLGAVLGGVLGVCAGSRNVDEGEPKETSVSSDEKSQTE